MKPDLRPDLLTLKARIQDGLRVANSVGARSEPWENFVHPGPDEAEFFFVYPNTLSCYFTVQALF